MTEFKAYLGDDSALDLWQYYVAKSAHNFCYTDGSTKAEKILKYISYKGLRN